MCDEGVEIVVVVVERVRERGLSYGEGCVKDVSYGGVE